MQKLRTAIIVGFYIAIGIQLFLVDFSEVAVVQ